MSSAHSSFNIVLCEYLSHFLNKLAVSNTEVNKLFIFVNQPFFDLNYLMDCI